MNKSIFGLNENLAAALAYLFAFVSGIVVLIMERENKFVRFAALQSTVFFLVGFFVLAILSFLSNIWLLGIPFAIAGWVLGTGMWIVWAYLVIKAFLGQTVKIPIIGDVCWDQVNK
ncbi:MAG: hypothetical protein FWE33_00480 [Defluviitaleaceae bacterium]|nr:hypothetical protein [Defluviitaleaceae bacterium]